MAEEPKRPDWMTSISANVKTEDYMLGRKVDKTFELSQQEKAHKAREARIELIANNRIKLSHDPILDLERRRYELKMELISNPIKMKQFRERLLQLEREKRHQSGRDDTEVRDEKRPSPNVDIDKCRQDNRSPERSRNRQESQRSHRERSKHHSQPDARHRDCDNRHRKESSSDRHREHHKYSKSGRHRYHDSSDRKDKGDSRRSRSPSSSRSTGKRHRH